MTGALAGTSPGGGWRVGGDEAAARHIVMAGGQANAEIAVDQCPTPNLNGEEPIAFKPSHYTRGKDGAPSDVMPPLSADADKGDQEPVVVAGETGHGFWQEGVQALRAEGENRPSRPSHVVVEHEPLKPTHPSVPRRLTPKETERLQAFPDDFTRYGVAEDGKEYELSDSARYRQMGNAVTVNVVEWIGRRIVECAGHD